VWKEFAGAPKGTNKLLTAMFTLFVLGLALIIISRVN
jgi:glucose uptake protein